MVLATDLDGTFLGGKSLHKQTLYRLIKNDKNIVLIFVTGRGLERVIPLLNDPIIPQPDYIICDVGATVVNGQTLEPIESLQNAIEEKWPGTIKIMNALKGIDGLQYQEVPQQRRCSFYSEDTDLNELVKEKVAKLNCDIIFSNKKFLDIVPKGINKGSTLRNLIELLGAPEEEVLVAGDTLNDLSMYDCGFKGVVVGKAESQLYKATQNNPLVYKAAIEGAGGILEAIDYFKLASVKTSQLTHVKIEKEKEVNEIPQLLMLYHRFPYEKKW